MDTSGGGDLQNQGQQGVVGQQSTGQQPIQQHQPQGQVVGTGQPLQQGQTVFQQPQVQQKPEEQVGNTGQVQAQPPRDSSKAQSLVSQVSQDRSTMQGQQSQVQQQVQPQAQAQVPVKGPTEPQVGRPAGAKEAEFVSESLGPVEHVPVVEMREPGELPTEVKGWIERAESDNVPDVKPVVHEGKTYATPAAPQQVKVTLPLDEASIKQGLHHKIVDSLRWLAEWCKRLVDKYKGQVGYKDRSQKSEVK